MKKATFGSLVHVTSLLKIKNYHIIFLYVKFSLYYNLDNKTNKSS